MVCERYRAGIKPGEVFHAHASLTPETRVENLFEQPDRPTEPRTPLPPRRRRNLRDAASAIRLVGALLVEINHQMISAGSSTIDSAHAFDDHQRLCIFR